MKYIRTKDGRILSLNEFKYEKKYHWYRPNEKYLSRLNIDFTLWHWCFDDEYDLVPEVLGKFAVEKIKREECKFADTIEELCDVIVCNEKLFYPLTSYDVGNHFNWKEIKEYSQNVSCSADYKGNAEDLYFKIYGAIWTDKGLIYVAKMNDKGELELL